MYARLEPSGACLLIYFVPLRLLTKRLSKQSLDCTKICQSLFIRHPVSRHGPQRLYLSSQKYGYDFVISVTQKGINSKMLNYLATSEEPVVQICYIADSEGSPQSIDYETLKTIDNGIDPFTLENGIDTSSNADFRNLYNARFMAGIQATPGSPAGSDASKIPEIVVLGSDASAFRFNLACSEFVIVQLYPAEGSDVPASWTRSSQTPDSP